MLRPLGAGRLGPDRCIFLLLDGARADVFRGLIDAGELPNVARWIVGPGALADATTVFPSVTNVGYASYLTGCFPGHHGVPGGAWLDRSRYARWRPSPWRFRHYRGLGHFWHDADLAPDVDTLFERLQPAANIFGVVGRGTPLTRNAFLLRRIPWALRFTQTGDWTPIDRRCGRRLLARARRGDSRFVFHVTLQVDEHSHLDGPFGPRVMEGYRRFDRWVGRLVAELRRAGSLERTLLVVGSDHGHIAVSGRCDLAGWLRRRGLATLSYPLSPTRWFRAEAAALVAGDAVAHVYLRGDGWRRRPSGDVLLTHYGPLVDDLLAEPAVDLIAWRATGGGVRVCSRRGNAHVQLDGDTVAYRPFGADPFGYGPLPRRLSLDAALRATQATDYPDGPVQIAQLFASPRTGDLVLSARPGWDFGNGRHAHRSGHGSLHRDHMRVPVAMNRPFDTSAVRTVDVAPTILRLLGHTVPALSDGRVLTADAASLRGVAPAPLAVTPPSR